MRSLVIAEQPFLNVQHFGTSPLDRISVFTRADSIYKSLNNESMVKSNISEGNTETGTTSQNGSNNLYNRSQLHDGNDQQQLRETSYQRNSSMISKSYSEDFEPRDSIGETFRNKTSKKYAHIKSKVDSNLHIKNDYQAKKPPLPDERRKKGNAELTMQSPAKDNRVHQEIVWAAPPNINGNQQKRSFSASPHHQHTGKNMDPTKSDKSPSRSRSASVHELPSLKIETSLYPSDFQSYLRQSEKFKDSSSISSDSRFYKKYLENKKSENTLEEMPETSIFDRRSSYDQCNKENSANTSTTLPVVQRQRTIDSTHRQPSTDTFMHIQNAIDSLILRQNTLDAMIHRQSTFDTLQRQAVSDASSQRQPTAPARESSFTNTFPVFQTNQSTDNTSYQSIINQQYQNYLKAKQKYFTRGIIETAIKTKPTELLTTNNSTQIGQQNSYKDYHQSVNTRSYLSTKEGGHNPISQNSYQKDPKLPGSKEFSHNQPQSRSFNILDSYLQQSPLSDDKNNKNLEMSSFKSQLSNSWNGAVSNEETKHNVRSRSNSHGSHTMPVIEHTGNTAYNSPAEQLKMMRNLSIGRSLPSIPVKNFEQSPTNKSDQWQNQQESLKKSKSGYENLPKLNPSVSNRLEQNQLLSMSLPTYLNYTDGILTKQSKHRNSTPGFVKKKKQVRINLECNRIHVYTPEYS